MNFNEKTMQKLSVIASLAVFANLLWGSAASVIKTGYALFQVASSDTAAQILFAGCRFFLAGILTIIIGSILQGKLLLPNKTAAPKIVVLSLFQTIIQYVLFYIGCANTSGMKASIAVSSGSFLNIVVSSLVFRQEKLNGRKIIGCFLGFGGVVLVNLKQGAGFDLNMSWLGEGFIILSSTAFAFSNAFTKRFSKTENPVMLCGYQFILGGAVMIAVGLISGGRLAAVGIGGILLVLYLALVSSVAFSITGILVKYNPVSKVSIYGFLNPVFGVIMSMLLLNESGQEFGYKGIVALVMVCIGVLTVNLQKEKKV